MIVADASVVVLAFAHDGARGEAARGRLSGERIAVPELLDLEVMAGWRKLEASGELDSARCAVARRELAKFQAERIRHRRYADRCWALRHNVTVYDAVYVALAEALGVSLVTADARLARAPGVRCRIEVL